MRRWRTPVLAACAIIGLSATAAATAPAYLPAGSIPLGAPDHWDYLVADPIDGRVYVAHGDRLDVVDARTGRRVGMVPGIAGGTHGIAISHAAGIGFTDDGRRGQAVAFDLGTLRVAGLIPAAEDADSIAADPLTGRIFVVASGAKSIIVIDPRSRTPIVTIPAGEELEFAAAGEPGTIYVAGEERGDLLKVDARTGRIVRRWPVPGCASPHGLAYDAVGERLFMGCENRVMMVIDRMDGRIAARLPIGAGSDAIVFDPQRRRVFSSNGADGTITIYQQRAPDHYLALEPLRTAVTGRTMTVDTLTGRLFVAAAGTQPGLSPQGRPRIVPGTLKVLMFDPADAPRR